MGKRKNKKKRKRKPLATPTKRDFSALILSLISFSLMWLAMPGPGRGHWWIAWLAPVPLVWLIHSNTPPYKVLRQVWIVSLLFWLLMLHFVRMPFWALAFGWLALATYLSVYMPIFIWLSRSLVHRFRVPTVIAVPIVFTGLEWIRVTFLSGFGLGCVSHTQYLSPTTMQIAELFGAYGVTFAIFAVAAAIAVATSFSWRQLSNNSSALNRIVNAVVAIILLAAVFGFGSSRLQQDNDLRKSAQSHRHLKVALIQSSIDTLLKPKTLEEVENEFIGRRDLTHAALSVSRDLDLIVWPESSFAWSDFVSDLSPTDTALMRQQNQQFAWQTIFPSSIDALPLLVGSTTVDPESDTVFNSAILFDQDGYVVGRYFKIHLVMFGEYFPIVHSIPILKELIKGFRSLNAGTEFEAFKLKTTSVAPNICFESTVPHLIRRQINTLEADGKEIGALVNVTNDGWFFGTSCLDLHLACNTFRAVETRRPVLVSANTGLSAHIDEFGRQIKLGPRREEANLICDVRIPYATKTFYRSYGAWFAAAMGWFVIALAIIDIVLSRRA